MSLKTLQEIETSIDQLDWQDKIRLLEYLAPRIAQGALRGSDVPAKGQPEPAEAMRRYREVSAQLAEASGPGAPSILEELSRSRR